MSLRVIHWLRRRKTNTKGDEISATSMRAVRRALAELRELALPIWRPRERTVLVDARGHVFVEHSEGTHSIDSKQMVLADRLDLIAPFDTDDGTHGPNLVEPRATLRIVPTKLSGAPHIAQTRIDTMAIASLSDAGLSQDEIVTLYPYLKHAEIADALSLESQLANNLAAA